MHTLHEQTLKALETRIADLERVTTDLAGALGVAQTALAEVCNNSADAVTGRDGMPVHIYRPFPDKRKPARWAQKVEALDPASKRRWLKGMTAMRNVKARAAGIFAGPEQEEAKTKSAPAKAKGINQEGVIEM
jgi:hypothetical protein